MLNSLTDSTKLGTKSFVTGSSLEELVKSDDEFPLKFRLGFMHEGETFSYIFARTSKLYSNENKRPTTRVYTPSTAGNVAEYKFTSDSEIKVKLFLK